MENLKKMMREEYKPVGSDPIKIYGFKFGMYRYQVEHFDHNHSGKPNDDKSIFALSFWDDIRGTRVYRILDWDYNFSVSSCIFFNKYIEKDELKELILKDTIDWKDEDPYDFKDRFYIEKEYNFPETYMINTLFPKDRDDVKLDYMECKNPYDKCPYCGGELDESNIETDSADDIFNSRGGYGYEGEPWGEWDEVHRCPHCDKLFYVHVEC